MAVCRLGFKPSYHQKCNRSDKGKTHKVVHVETNEGQHWPVLHLVGSDRSPHNEGRPSAVHPKRWLPPSAAATFLGISLCGDLWIPTRCSSGQCCPPSVSTCMTYYMPIYQHLQAFLRFSNVGNLLILNHISKNS